MSKVNCTHCDLDFDENIMIKDGIHHFCCSGCQGVFHLLNDEGLNSFYERKGDTKLESLSNNNYESSDNFNLDSFKDRYIKKDKNGFSKINLIIEGIHCSACVWLNEKVLQQSDGVLQADINFSTHKAQIIWDEDEIKLSQIIDKIRSIGYNAYPYDVSKKEKDTNLLKRDHYIRLIVAVFGSMNIMTLSIAKYGGWFSGMQNSIELILEIAEFIIATPVLFYSGWIYFRGAYYALKNRFINMDFLVSVGASLTYIYSIYAIFSPVAHTYFDSVVMIITFVSIGKFLEILSKKSIIDQLDSLITQIPQSVIVVVDNNKILTPSIDVRVGDTIEIKAGERVVIDGVISSGTGSFDESSLSGEATPILKYSGNSIISGSLLLDSSIRYKAVKTYEDSTLNTLITLSNDAMNKKPKIEKFSNELSGKFSLIILIIALLTFIGWYAISSDFENSFIVAISVIVIACPCALALATPIASLVGINKATKNSLIFKEAAHLESMSKCDVLVLDKTGTITKGKPSITSFDIKDSFDINILYSLVSHSSHPISKSIKTYITKEYENLIDYNLEEILILEAKGIKALYNGIEIIGGSRDFLLEEGIAIIESELYNSSFYFSINRKLTLIATLDDKIKNGAKELIAKMDRLNIQSIMLSGDNESVSKKIAFEIGIKEYRSKLSPKDKAEYIKKLKKDNKVVVMVGDGINDSLALAHSDIAIAMGSGADIAIDVSDIIILDNSLVSLQNGFEIATQTFSNIKQNLLISLLYNAVTIPLAIAGYVIPMVAALSMSFSSLLVVANSYRIKLKRVKNVR